MTTLKDLLVEEKRRLDTRARNAFARVAKEVEAFGRDPSRLTTETVRGLSATLAMIQTDLATCEGLDRAMELAKSEGSKP